MLLVDIVGDDGVDGPLGDPLRQIVGGRRGGSYHARRGFAGGGILKVAGKGLVFG
jgi:hypothetical protein